MMHYCDFAQTFETRIWKSCLGQLWASYSILPITHYSSSFSQVL